MNNILDELSLPQCSDFTCVSDCESSSDESLTNEAEEPSILSTYTSDSSKMNYTYDKEEMKDLFKNLSRLFSANKYYEILTLIPSLHHYVKLSNPVCIIIASTLFALGRGKAALREIALVIEKENDPEEKERYIQYLIDIFKQLGMGQRAVACFNELIAIKKTEIMISYDDVEKSCSLNEQVKLYERALSESKNDDKNSLYLKMESLPIHEQAQNYLKASGNLHFFSLGRICIQIKSTIDEAIVILKAFSTQKKKKISQDPLKLIFDALMLLGPRYLYLDLLNYTDSIIEHIKKNTALQAADDKDPLSVLSEIRKGEKNSSESSYEKYGEVVKHKFIFAYLNLLQEDYNNAVVKYEWILQFIDQLPECFRSCISKNSFLSHVTKSVVTVLLNRCFLFGDIDCDKEKSSEMFSQLLESTTLSTRSEYLCGRLASYFVSFGQLYQRAAIKQAAKITIECEDPLKTVTAIRLETTNTEEMVRKYIIASANKAHDDPTVISLYDMIIWGLLCHGGIHLKTLWFFIFIRHYFHVEFDFGALHTSPSHGCTELLEEEIFNRYSNGWELVEKIFDLRFMLTREEQESIWDPSNGNLFLAPQIFDAGAKLLLMDSFYDENLRSSSSNFVFVSEFQVKHKLRSHIKLQGRSITQQLEVSRDLISFWCSAYEECHGLIPSAVRDFLME